MDISATREDAGSGDGQRGGAQWSRPPRSVDTHTQRVSGGQNLLLLLLLLLLDTVDASGHVSNWRTVLPWSRK